MSIIRSTEGLRNFLFEELERLRNGKSTPQNALTAAKLAQQVYNTCKLEIDAARFLADQRTLSANADSTKLKPLQLGKSSDGD